MEDKVINHQSNMDLLELRIDESVQDLTEKHRSEVYTLKRDLDQGPDMCVDGDLETMCTTLRKAYSSITLDFGEPVEIAKVIAHKYSTFLTIK